MTTTLFDAITVGGKQAKNRIWFAPCTRHRAYENEVPTPIMRTYYEQRSTAGLIITEGVNPSPYGRGYHNVPALYNDDHEAGWRPVVEAVHERGSLIFAQLMHVGRLSYPELLPGGSVPVGPSAVQPDPEFRGYTFRCPKPTGKYGTPHALTLQEIKREVEQFGQAAERAVRAGFDGIEIHGASGYLPMQFLSTTSNVRTDEYGGPVENRARFLLECANAAIERIGSDRVAVKLSPGFYFHDVANADDEELYTYLIPELDALNLAFLEVSSYGDYYMAADINPYDLARRNYGGLLVANGGLSQASGESLLAGENADAISYGVLFISNPDLPERFSIGSGLNAPDVDTFYWPAGPDGAAGYIDYPSQDEAAAAGTGLLEAGSTLDSSALDPAGSRTHYDSSPTIPVDQSIS